MRHCKEIGGMSFRRGCMVGAAVLLLMAALLAACRERRAESQRRSHCPAQTLADEPRTMRLLSRLRKLDEARAILVQVPPMHTICYGDMPESALDSSGAILLSRNQDDRANAARLAHLLLHYAERTRFEDSALRTSLLPCPELVEGLMAVEHRAHAVEDRVRQALGLGVSLNTLDALRDAYLDRCRQLRSGDGANGAIQPLDNR